MSPELLCFACLSQPRMKSLSNHASLEGLADAQGLQARLAIIISSEPFDLAMVCLVSLNLLIAVYEADARATGNPYAWCDALGVFFLIIYVFELAARIWLDGVQFFFSKLNIFDTILVFADLFLSIRGQVGDAQEQPPFVIFRVVRVMRLLRVIRRIAVVRELWLMLHGMVSAMKAMIFAVTFIVISCIILSVLAVDLIQPYNEQLALAETFHEDCVRCPVAFSSISRATYTWFLLIFAGELWGDMAVPIMEAAPGLVLIFLPAFVMINLGLLNLILTVIVDRAAEAREDDQHQMIADKEEQMKKAQQRLLKICAEMDDDDSGCLTLQEMEQGFETNKEFAASLKIMDVGQADLKTVFNILDDDKSGTITYREFVDQIHKMKTQESHTILVFIKHYVMEIKSKVHESLEVFKQSIEEEIQRDLLQMQQLHEFRADGQSGRGLDSAVEAVPGQTGGNLAPTQQFERISRRIEEGLASLEGHAAQRAKENATLAKALAPSLAAQMQSSGLGTARREDDGGDFFAVILQMPMPSTKGGAASGHSQGDRLMPMQRVQNDSSVRNRFLM